MKDRVIPDATVGRLPIYLRTLLDLGAAGAATVSSDTLAEGAGVNSAKVRKDLSYVGSYGVRGVGYDIDQLVFEIRRELGLDHNWPILIAGIGNLGHALANYHGFAERGFEVAALVDVDRTRVGERVGGLVVSHLDEMEALVKAKGVAIGVVATPPAAAQEVADRMVASGIRSILNFAPATIAVREGVSLRKVDLSVELQILAFYGKEGTGAAAGASARQKGSRDGL